MPRMNILNTVEREAFNSPPVFSSFQRKQYFDFPSKLRRFAAGLHNRAYQLGFLLSAGYFKAARRFFSPGSFHPRDIEYVARQLEPGAPTVDFAQYHPRARQRHQHTIRTFYGFRACDSAACRLLLKEIAGLVRSQVKPKVIFWRCIDVLVRESWARSIGGVKSLPRSSSGASPRKCARFWKTYLRRNGSWATPSPAKPAPTSSP